ncbi:MAG TPA: Mur ligase domain-containing protein [Candidatus Saccharimonadales bacterium]
MHVYFSGIGGTAIGPLALIAHQAGFAVSGSDQQNSLYIDYLKKHGVTDIHIGQEYGQIADVNNKQPIDWFVYTSALPIEHPDAPELSFCQEHDIKTSKRDEFLNHLLDEKKQKLLAIAGTHGKTTTTAMAIWLFKRLGIPVSYSVGAKLSFGEMGEFSQDSEYFIYEADEFDHNFLAFHPRLSLITGIDWDHPDIYPTRDEYNSAFRQFLKQSEQTIIWNDDAGQLEITGSGSISIISPTDPDISSITLPGLVNRLDAFLVAQGVARLTGKPLPKLLEHMNAFPGVARRFEQIIPNLFSDYAHTPPKIRGALQLAHEVAGDNVVVVYEGLHNTRQHFIKDELKPLFDNVKQLYIVPSYLAREDPNLQLLSPEDIKAMLSETTQKHTTPAELDNALASFIQTHLDQGDLVLCITAGGGKSLDEWVRKEFSK